MYARVLCLVMAVFCCVAIMHYISPARVRVLCMRIWYFDLSAHVVTYEHRILLMMADFLLSLTSVFDF